MGWPFNTRPATEAKPGPNPAVRAVYDGFRDRTKRHMIVVLPGSEWGGKPYGLGPEDDFSFVPPKPPQDSQVTVHLSPGTMSRLMRQRDLRATHRRRRR